MRIKMLTCAVAASAALLVAACGSDDDDTSTSDTTQADTAATEADSGSSSASLVGTQETDLGEVLDQRGGPHPVRLHAGLAAAARRARATAPPPGRRSRSTATELPAGLDAETYSVIERPDGTYQLAADEQPLYTFGGDEQPGDVNGQGVGGSWFAVDAGGQLLQDASAGGSGSGSERRRGDHHGRRRQRVLTRTSATQARASPTAGGGDALAARGRAGGPAPKAPERRCRVVRPLGGAAAEMTTVKCRARS